MKQVLQSLKNGETYVIDVPRPQLQPGHIMVQTTCSLISTGTEKMLVEFGKASLINKARLQPDKVSMALDKIKTDGILATVRTVRDKLDQYLPMGYCNVGKVMAVGRDVKHFSVGDRVVSNGPHAEVIVVPKNLCCKIPDDVDDESAVFTVAGAISLQGIRLLTPTLGENFVVIGLGLIGLLTVQLLHAQGCRVFGMDLDPKRAALAEKFGAEVMIVSKNKNAIAWVKQLTRERGCDGVVITASTESNKPIQQAAEMCRPRGRIILIGVTGLKLSRTEFYKKELTFQVSCSYGPGRYDPNYEILGQDYPLGFVRWTAQRNFEAFLDMLSEKKIHPIPLISSRYPIIQAKEAYAKLGSQLGVVLSYSPTPSEAKVVISVNNKRRVRVPEITLGIIGAGQYASRILIPLFANTGVNLQTIVCRNGISGVQCGKKYGFRNIATDVRTIFEDKKINTVIIATRHDTHADFVCEAIRHQKNVFVEKPLCLSLSELDNIKKSLQGSQQLLMIGFNRRFAPHIKKIKSLLKEEKEPKALIMTVNAGEIPPSHWTQTIKEGGGRIVGEACHFIDLLRYLVDAPITSFQTSRMKNIKLIEDKLSISLQFLDGSIGTIHYLANGHRGYQKERLDIFVSGKIIQLNNFRKLQAFGFSPFKKMNLFLQDKGQANCVRDFVSAIQYAKASPIPLAEILEVSQLTLEIAGNP